jgi:LytS/YehU family sensor histidine kinase
MSERAFTLRVMTWPWWVLGFAVGTGLGFGLGRASKKPPPSVPDSLGSSSWIERHQRLKDSAGIAAKNTDVHDQRERTKHQTLQMQLSPHFMFNALSSVQWLWADSKHDQARDCFASFVHLWRRHWTDASSSSHSLRKELASLEEYVHLESSRRGTAVAWRVRLVGRVNLDAEVPALLFQPALENALWHGFAEMPADPTLEITVQTLDSTRRDPWISVHVRDNGKGLPIPTSASPRKRRTSLGLTITRDRLRALHPHASVQVASAAAPWSTETTFTLPARLPAS